MSTDLLVVTTPEGRLWKYGHYSDCAIHNAPAYRPEECDCGRIWLELPQTEGLLEPVAGK